MNKIINKQKFALLILSGLGVANAGMNNLLHCKLGYLEGARDEVVELLDEQIEKLETLKTSNIEAVQRMNMIIEDGANSANSWQGPIKELLNKAKKTDLSKFELEGGLDLSELNPLKKYGDAITAKVEEARNKSLNKINEKVTSLNNKINAAQDKLNSKLTEFSDTFSDSLDFKLDLNTSDITAWKEDLASEAGYVSPDFGLATTRPNFDMCNLDKSIEDLIKSCKSISSGSGKNSNGSFDNFTGNKVNEDGTNADIIGMGGNNKINKGFNVNNGTGNSYFKKSGIQIDKDFGNNGTTKKDGTIINTDENGNNVIGSLTDEEIAIKKAKIQKIQNENITEDEALASYSTAEGKCQILEDYKQQLDMVKQQLLDYSKQLILAELEKLLSKFVGLQQIMEVQNKVQCSMKATIDAATNMGALAVGFDAMSSCLDGADESIDTATAGDIGMKMASVPVGPIVVPIPFSQISMSPNAESNALDAAASTAMAVASCMGEGYGAGWTKAYKDCLEGKAEENNRMESLDFDLNFKFLDNLKDFKKQKCIMDKKSGEDFSVFGNLKEIAETNFDQYKSAYEDILNISKGAQKKTKDMYKSSRNQFKKVSNSFGNFYKDFFKGTSAAASYVSLHELTVKKIYGPDTKNAFISGLLNNEPSSYIKEWNKQNGDEYNKIKPENFELVYMDNQLGICKNRLFDMKKSDTIRYTQTSIKLMECQIYLENILITKISDIYVFEKEPLYIDSNLIQKNFLLKSIYDKNKSIRLRDVSYKNLKKFYGIKE
jgi:hypothetical protein